MSRAPLRSESKPTEAVVDADAFAAEVRALLPPALAVGLAFAPPADHRAELLPEERSAIARAVDRRIHEFSTGRVLARRAMAAIGLAPGAVPRGAGREPSWPTGCIGSITHAHGLVGAAIARAVDLRGLGIDLEVAGRLKPELHRRILTDRERAGAGEGASSDPLAATLRFSAKEAVYKAVHPIVGRFIGFHEVEVTSVEPNAPHSGEITRAGSVQADQGRFRMRYVGDHAANRVMESGEGWYLHRDGYVFTLFSIP